MDGQAETIAGFPPQTMVEKDDSIVLGGGCFWCLEAVFKEIAGVKNVVSGYAGGQAAEPSYEQVSSGTTGHAEVVKVSFDPRKISLRELFEVFFLIHDPTTLNRQGGDIGEQYRSIILYANEEQKEEAEKIIHGLNEAGAYGSKIVTEVKPLTRFFEAEEYHQDYMAKHQDDNPYCRLVINPKLQKFREKFNRLLKKPNLD